MLNSIILIITWPPINNPIKTPIINCIKKPKFFLIWYIDIKNLSYKLKVMASVLPLTPGNIEKIPTIILFNNIMIYHHLNICLIHIINTKKKNIAKKNNPRDGII